LIITGDHTSLSDNSAYDHVVGRFRVPIIFHDPSGTLPLDQAGKIATHIDLKPTIMDLLGVESSKFGLFGGPLFRDDWQGRFIQSNADRWYYRDNLVQVTLDTDEQASAYDLRDTNLGQPKHLSPEQLKQVRLLKAARQYFYNGLLDNSWYQKKTNGSVE
jgi:arylsulfatase A-like enzyme